MLFHIAREKLKFYVGSQPTLLPPRPPSLPLRRLRRRLRTVLLLLLLLLLLVTGGHLANKCSKLVRIDCVAPSRLVRVVVDVGFMLDSPIAWMD